ncbi:threonine/homoserine/homoserine lactone efflux protein [Leeuwenhoekiella aestuarii]|uniref:Threonine/homoserine/homoserine lactone efflux protein n=1 Tax=Leeuwenhoekiella aestuarii TaxID=2249426 RepID=A0A4Q0NYQ8_9FLAO|nr:LysE family transporter [Leeuwenhoekiella aestuarii]RXG17947.1 threonine/homoserine/homoserine lactone efflux protein [Leeuwenhoekiella aestuarii]RXG19276.1 threonine/homoserine/homoserine lactone efflux protein [Leeuwenhoekiella aestuarii]
MLQDLSTAIPLGFLLAFLVGPVFFVLLETAALKGFRAAFIFDIGVVTADTIFILIAYFSTNQLLDKLKDDPALFIFGGMLLTVYGVISFLRVRKNKLDDDEHPTVVMSKRNYLGLFVKGFLLNFINIGVLGFWLVILISAGPQLDMNSDRLLIFFGGILATYLFIDIIKILLAKKLRSKLTPTRIALIKKIISVLMFLFGLLLISKGLFPSKIHQIEKRIEEIAPENQFNLDTDSITL